MKSPDYLTEYYPFDAEVLDAVAEAAEQQDHTPFDQLAQQYELNDTLRTFVPQYTKKPIQTLEFTPTGDFDKTTARVYHLPMANALGPNMIMRGMRLFAADQSERLILQANPSAPGMPEGKVSLLESARAWHNNDLRPFVNPLLQHLHDRGIERVKHLGYSYGADKALTAVRQASAYDQDAAQAVYAEPVSVADRSMVSLAISFGKSNSQLQKYVKETDSESYSAERDKENMAGFVGYIAALGRMSNLAIAKTLATSSFQKRVEQTQFDEETRTAIAWGTESELVPTDKIEAIVKRLQDRSYAPISAMQLRGMHHAGGDDINLHTAVMLQGLKLTTPPPAAIGRY